MRIPGGSGGGGSSGSDTRLDPVQIIKDFNDPEEGWGSIGAALRAGIGGIIVTITSGIALGVDAIRMLFTEPLLALIDGTSGLIFALVGGAGDIIEQGVETAVLSLAPGAAWAVGPLTYAFSIGVVGLGLFVLAQILEERATSDLIPFTFTDWPIIGTDEEGEGN